MMPVFLGYILVFLVVSSGFIFVHLMMGKLLRPIKPDTEKQTIYECGEPTVGSAWIQFDLRYYVVALLFVIFDVEVVFFFPWAVVFGKANQVANPDIPVSLRNVAAREMFPRALQTAVAAGEGEEESALIPPAAASKFAWLSFLDIFVFFCVLLVGFAYLWKRGDLDWVRSTQSDDSISLSSPRMPEAIIVSEVGSAATPVGVGE